MIQKINKRSKTIGCFAVLFAMLFWFPVKVNAQNQKTWDVAMPTRIDVESSSTTFSYLTGGITTAGINNGGGLVSGALPIGFTFYMGNTPYTSFYVSSNATMSFDKAFNAATSVTSSIAGSALLAPLWGNYVNGIGADAAFTYLTTGTAPNRVLTAEWKNWKWKNFNAPVISFQVKIYEGTNNIEYIYKKEGGAFVYQTTGATIGVYNDIDRAIPQQIWLSDFTSNPGIRAEYDTQSISTLPADGQLYRFIQNTQPAQIGYYGLTSINPNGGTKPMNASFDGISVILSGTGNMQVKKNNLGQIYKGPVNPSASAPYLVPGTSHGFALSIGDKVFSGGTLYSNPNPNKLLQVSSTEQSLIETSPGHFRNVIKLVAPKNGLNYYLEVEYIYNYPDSNVLINYKVTIPEGNTEPVKFAHGWDSFLGGNDLGPGFALGEWDNTAGQPKPNFVMGVIKLPAYEAFQYLGGIPWSGYFTGNIGSINPTLVRNSMKLDNQIDTAANVDNGIAISIDFGSAPGTFESNNSLVFACPAGDLAPDLSSIPAKACFGTTFNLNDYIVSPPPGVVAQWKNASGLPVTDPTNVSVAGTYTVSFYSGSFACSSPPRTVNIAYDYTCAVCYKPALTTGTKEASKTIVSTLDRTSIPRNWSDSRTGSLILESTNKGLVLTRIASPETAITKPIEGMIVYDTANNVIKLYNGTDWRVIQQSCPDY